MKSNRQDKKNPFGNHVGILLALSPPDIWPWPWTRARVHYAAKSSTNSYPSQLRTFLNKLIIQTLVKSVGFFFLVFIRTLPIKGD